MDYTGSTLDRSRCPRRLIPGRDQRLARGGSDPERLEPARGNAARRGPCAPLAQILRTGRKVSDRLD